MAGNPLASLPGLPQRPSLARSSASETRLTQPGIEAAWSRKLNSAPTAAFRIMDVMHERCAGLDVHKATIVACVRTVTGGKVNRECRTFDTTTAGLPALLAWLTESGCTHVAMEATGV